MIVRFRFRTRDLDDLGVLRAESLRRLATSLWDTPAGVRVVVDLGPCRQVQQQLIRDLSLYRCAWSVQFESSDWRIVRDHTRALGKALGVPT
jgi:hypothetical protein